MDTADSLIDHGQEVLHDRLQAIHSFRSLQIERDAQIDDLQAYIHQLQEKNSWLEDRNMILEHCLEEKSIELDQAFNTIRSYEGRLQSSEDAIQELQIKRDAAIYESNKLLKVMVWYYTIYSSTLDSKYY
jgi:chromosome segregation ATPase